MLRRLKARKARGELIGCMLYEPPPGVVWNLSLGDLDLAGGLLRVTIGKGARDRVVPLGQVAVAAVANYLSHARPALLGAGYTDQLFISYRGNPFVTCASRSRI